MFLMFNKKNYTKKFSKISKLVKGVLKLLLKGYMKILFSL